MKKKILFILTSIISLVCINCSNDDNYVAKSKYQFPFIVETVKDETYYANERQTMLFSPVLDEERDNVKLEYTFKLNVDNDKVVAFYDGEKIKFGNSYSYKKNKLEFIFSEKGQYEIKLNIENQYGYAIEHREIINVTEIDFYLSLSYEDLIYPKISKGFNLDISPKEEEDKKKDITYKFSYEFISKEDEKLDVVYNSKKLSNKEETTYNGKEISFKFPSFGEYDILLTAISSQGKKVTKKETIVVSPVEFEFNLENNNKVYPNTKTLFKLKVNNITEDILQKYNFRYEISSKNSPVITYNSTIISPNKFIPYSGEDIYITFSEADTYDIKIIMENQYGSVIEKEFTYNVNFANFDVEIKDFPKEIFIDKEYVFNVLPKMLENTDDEESVNYTFKIKYNEDVVKLTYDDSTLPSDTYVKYKGSKIKATFKKQGSLDMTYYFKNSQGLEISKKTTTDVKVATFDLEVIKPTTIKPLAKVPFKIKPIKSNFDDVKYTFNVSTNAEGAKFYYNGVEVSKDLTHDYKNENLEVMFPSDGTFEVTVTMKNSHNQIVSKKTVLVVEPIKFVFDVKTEGKIYPTEKQPFSLEITPENSKDKQTYEFAYKVTKSIDKPVLQYNNSTILENSFTKIDNENFYITFSKSGVYEIEYTLRNQFGYTQKRVVTYDVNYANFDIKVSELPKDIFINKKYNISFSPELTDGKDKQANYQYKIVANPSVKAFYNGYQISLNNYASYSNQIIEFEFNKEGEQEVTIFLKNSQGLEVSKKVVFNVKVATFTLDISKDIKYLANQKGKLLIKPIDKSGLKDITYKVNITYPKDLKVSYKGSQIASDMDIAYTNETFEVEAVKSGTYELNVTMENNHNQRVQQKVIIDVETVKFNFNVETEGNFYPNKQKAFKIKPTFESQEPKQQLKIKYLAKGSYKPVLSYNGNTLYENEYVNFNSENLAILFSNLGTNEVEFTLQNQFGYTVSKTIRFNVTQTKFDVEIKELPKVVFIDNAFDIQVQPIAEEEINLTYQIKILNPNLIVKYNGYQAPLNTYIDYNSSNLNMSFTQGGQQEVTIFIKNNQGLEVSKKIAFDVKVATFDIQVTKDKMYLPNKRTPIKIKPVDNSGLSNISYTFDIVKNNDVKVFYRGNEIGNIQQKYTDEVFEIEPLKAGRFELTVNFENNHKQKKTEKIIIEVNPIVFNFSLDGDTELIPNEKKVFILKPTFENTVSQTFKFKYNTKTNLKPRVSYTGSVIYENDFINYSSPSLELTFPQTGVYEMDLTMENQYGHSITKPYRFNVTHTDFKIEISNQPKEVYVNNKFTLGVKPVTSQENKNITYQMKVIGSGDMTAYYNSYPFALNNYIPFDKNSLDFSFSSTGQKEVTIFLKNSQGLEVQEKLLFNVVTANTKVDFEVPQKVYPLKETLIKANVSNSVTGIKTKFKINSDNNNVIIKNNNTQIVYNYLYDYSNSNFSFVFPKSGKYTITWDFENNLGGKQQSTLVVDVIDTNYEIRVEKPTQIFPNVSADFRIAVIETLKSTYKYKYSIQGGNGGLVEVKQGNNRIYADEWNNYSNSEFKFNFPNEGNYVLVIDFINEYGKEIKKRIDIKVEQPKFTVEVVNNNSSIVKNEDFPLAFISKKTPANQEITFTIKGDNNVNSIKYGGRTVYLGEELTLNDQNIVFNMKEGTHNIAFEFKNQFGFKMTKTISVTVGAKDYQTKITNRILSSPISGYNQIFYENPVRVAIDINSLLQAKDLKIRFRNSSLIDANGTYYPNVFYDLTKLNNTFDFNFDKSINGQANNILVVDVQDFEGKITSHNITLPINIKADKPYIEDITDKTVLNKYASRIGETSLFIGSNIKPSRPILVTTPVGIRNAEISMYIQRFPEASMWSDKITSITKKDNNTYEIVYDKELRWWYWTNGGQKNHAKNTDVIVITYKVTDNLGQESTKITTVTFNDLEIKR